MFRMIIIWKNEVKKVEAVFQFFDTLIIVANIYAHDWLVPLEERHVIGVGSRYIFYTQSGKMEMEVEKLCHP
jgi:hypothetical protein